MPQATISDRIHQATSRLEQYTSSHKQDKTVALLTALLEYAPTQAGREYLGLEISSCEDDGALYRLGERYITGLILPMRAQGGKTPAVSDHPSRPSAEINEQDSYHLIESARRDQSLLKKWCLRRDNFRCLISGAVDWVSYRSGKVETALVEIKEFTVPAHIIPFSIAAKDDRLATVQRSSAIFQILSRFGGVHLHDLNGDGINGFQNILTLTPNMHVMFGSMEIWLDAVDGSPNTYRLRKADPGASLIPEGTLIRFHSHDQQIPLPDPRYIAIHAASAKVCHASGAAEVVDRILREYEETKCLAKDGSSSQTLDNALRLVSVL